MIVIFGCNWEETKPNIRVIRSKRTGCAEHVVCMGGDKIQETFLSTRFEGKNAVGRPRPV